MSHTHSFPREADDVEWDDENDLLIVKRTCEEFILESSGPSMFGPPDTSDERPCEVVQKTSYVVNSVTDIHDNHSLECSSVVVREDGYVSKNSVHVSDLDETPDWVEKIIDIVRGRAKENSHIAHTTRLMGKQFSPLIATSEGEYNITFDKVDQWVEG